MEKIVIKYHFRNQTFTKCGAIFQHVGENDVYHHSHTDIIKTGIRPLFIGDSFKLFFKYYLDSQSQRGRIYLRFYLLYKEAATCEIDRLN